jgi:hypothetical protein
MQLGQRIEYGHEFGMIGPECGFLLRQRPAVVLLRPCILPNLRRIVAQAASAV